MGRDRCVYWFVLGINLDSFGLPFRFLEIVAYRDGSADNSDKAVECAKRFVLESGEWKDGPFVAATIPFYNTDTWEEFIGRVEECIEKASLTSRKKEEVLDRFFHDAYRKLDHMVTPALDIAINNAVIH